ncbi:uncharacterized protein LOC126808906 [Patella vulgata]|uniref:uncharacterized protein LOC126808906 n=1 Tax=Patella vulgata TaxID=6465 RepID=UPI00217FE2F2|nr:uncharacterized protein LOC126808906 [Patella vulgata]
MKIAMLCLRGAPRTEESEILDIKKILEDFAWNNFKSTQGVCAKTFLRRRDFIVDVPLNFYHTEDVNQQLTPRQLKKEPSRSGYDHKHGDHTSDLRTEFRNNTETNQTYKFRFERTRKASVTVTFQKGFTFGGKAHFSLGLPVAGGRSSGDVNMTLQVTKTDAENFEDTLVLETTSDISVEKKHSYITGVILKHRDVSYDFTLDTIITMPLNKAPVAIRKRKGGEVLSSFYIENLKDVFLDFPNVEFIPQRSADGKSQRYSVKIRTSGIVEGVQLSDQEIFLDSKKIESEDKSTSTLDIVPPTLARPTDLGTPITPSTTSKDDTSVKVTTDDTTDAKAADRLKDPQTATERRTSFKRFNQFGENYTSLTASSPETKILQTPKIPTIIKTSPTTPRVSPVPTDSEAAFPKHRLREVTPKRSTRPKSPLLMNSPSSFQGTSPQTQRPKLSKMTSV